MELEKLQEMEFFKDQDLAYAFDGLTKVLDREMILNYARFLIKKKIPFTICLADIDNFKNVNDGYGHMMGDIVLARFAKHINDIVADRGVVGRYGGDEFMMILPNITEYNDVWSICHEINMKTNEVKFDRAEDLFIILTTGISRYPIDGRDFDTLLATADKALYRGKMKGRNCFIIYLAAKHAQIMLKTDTEKSYTSMEMLSRVMNIMTKNKDIKANIDSVLRFFISYLQEDHCAIECDTKTCAEAKHVLCTTGNFRHIDPKLTRREMNSYGLMFLNNTKTLLLINSKPLYEELKEQNILSLFSFDIKYGDKVYGVLRVDSPNQRVWQAKEMDLFTVAAKLIAYELYNQNTTLEELYKD